MDNLYYGLPENAIIKTYDLKGSKRNRWVKDPTKSSTLLDTNFKVDRNGEPIPVKAQHKDFMNTDVFKDAVLLCIHVYEQITSINIIVIIIV